MPFGMVSGVGRGMGVLDFGGDRRRGRDRFGGEFGASHCNQWGICDALFSNYFQDLLVSDIVMLFTALVDSISPSNLGRPIASRFV